MKKSYVSILTVILILLVCVNITFAAFAMRASNTAARAYEERHAITSAIYEASIAGGAFTRLARYYAITGSNSAYEQFFEELELDRYGHTLNTFTAYGAHPHEIELFGNVIDLRMQMLDIHKEVLRLRRAGYTREAIDLAHGPELQAVGMPAGPMSDEARDTVYERTTETAQAHQRMAGIFGNLTVATSVLLVLGGILLLVFSGIAAMPRRVDAFGAAFLVLACATLFLTMSARASVEEELDVYEQQRILINASYNAERGGEILTRMARMFVVTGNEAQYDSYFAELGRDRFGHAFEAYILLGAESCEINTLIDVLGRLTMLRQIEAQAIILRSTGYHQEALELAFSPEVAALDKPLAILGEELREAVNARTRGIIDAAARSHDIFLSATIIAALLLIATGCGILINVRNFRKETVPGFVAHALKKISNATIRAKLFASFSIVIILFTAQVGISSYYDMQINQLNRHNVDYLMDRSDILWAYHQEFTEMRRHLRETYLSSSWLASANEAEWLMAEQRLSDLHAHLTYLKDSYVASVIADPIFPVADEDSRIVIWCEIMSQIDEIYDVYRENFFLSGNRSLDPGNVMDYTGSAETLILLLRQFVTVNRGVAEERIMHFQNYSITVTAVSLAVAILSAILLTVSMLRTFTNRIKVIEETVDKVAQGDFESDLSDGTDEITAMYSKLLEVFTNLINEINRVTDEGRKGNIDARIDSDRYQGKHKETALAINTLLDAAEEMLRQKELSLVAQKANEEKSKFLARMSHEIRTPITAVLGISEICLRSSALSHYLNVAFSKIHDSALTLLNIVNDILDFSKIEAGKMHILDKEYEVAKLIGHATQMHTFYMEHETVNLQVHVDGQLPALLKGDILRIGQIINNLITNAFKYTESGSIFLSFARGKEDGDYVDLVIVIGDTGIGMSENQLEVIKTNEYSRFYETEEGYVEGTGLGIPIVYSLAQAMNGQVDFESEVGKGTTVRVSIPQKICTQEILGDEAAANLQNYETYSWQVEEKFKFIAEPMPYGKVLVVDDIDANLFVAKGLLAFYGISVETCTSGQDAISKIEQGSVYDIVFMDILMPDLDGTETMRIMRDKGYNAPIVALTANALVGQAEEFTKSGFDDFVSKPIISTHLDDVLVKFIRDKQTPEVIAEARANAKPSAHEVMDGGFASAEQLTHSSEIDSFMGDASVIEKLRVDFARKQRNAIRAIKQALDAGDTKTAHRLAHSIKSSAGLIGEHTLVQIAQDAEDSLRDEKAVTEAQLSDLENEFTLVLENIKIPQHVYGLTDMSKDDVNELLDKLETLLKSQNADSLKLIEQLRNIPEAAILVRQMDDFDFELAAKSVETLRLIYGE